MQMQIGRFRFEVEGAEYQELLRRRVRRWAARERHGRPPELEDLGRDADRIELSGTVWVESSADLAALDELVEIAGLERGREAELVPVFIGGGVGSSGESLGMWAVEDLETTESALRQDGIPTLIEFRVRLLEGAGS